MRKEDISICHRLGQKNLTKPRQVICKFISRKTKWDLLSHKKKLKESDDFKRVYITEDLTRLRLRMLEMLRENPKTQSVYTRDGKIVCFLKDQDRRYYIDSPDDLSQLGYKDVYFARLGLQDLTAPYGGVNGR